MFTLKNLVEESKKSYSYDVNLVNERDNLAREVSDLRQRLNNLVNKVNSVLVEFVYFKLVSIIKNIFHFKENNLDVVDKEIHEAMISELKKKNFDLQKEIKQLKSNEQVHFFFVSLYSKQLV